MFVAIPFSLLVLLVDSGASLANAQGKCQAQCAAGVTRNCTSSPGHCLGNCRLWYGPESSCSLQIDTAIPVLSVSNETDKSLLLSVTKGVITDSLLPYFKFVVQLQKAGDDMWLQVIGEQSRWIPSAVNVLLDGLQYNTVYTIRLLVYRSQYNVTHKPIEQNTTGRTTCRVPSQPDFSVCQHDSAREDVSYSLADIGCSALSKVMVQYFSGSAWIIATTGTHKNDTLSLAVPVDRDTQLRFRLVVVNSDGRETISAEKTVLWTARPSLPPGQSTPACRPCTTCPICQATGCPSAPPCQDEGGNGIHMTFMTTLAVVACAGVVVNIVLTAAISIRLSRR